MAGFFARLRSALLGAVGFVLRFALVLLVFEGAASVALIAVNRPGPLQPTNSEAQHTRYDAELGWVNVPNTRIPDLYGPGRSLTINGQGFRNRRDFAVPEPLGRVRAICSGDSFTFGFGVGDADTWCARLETRIPGLETVNMGQDGYGIDQAYLWYARDGVALDHRLHLFAFVREDFGRMQATDFRGYAKPVLRVEGDALAVHGVPVPRRAYYAPWLRNAELVRQLRSVQLVRPVVRALFPRRGPELTMGELTDLTLRVFEELQQIHARRGSLLVLIYLPTRDDVEAPHDRWRQSIRSEAQQRGLVFVDLVEAMRRLPRRKLVSLFGPGAAMGATQPDGHYSPEGHAWVAGELEQELQKLPEVRALLSELDTAR